MDPGVRDELITEAVLAQLAALAEQQVHTETLDPATAPARLAKHLFTIVGSVLASATGETSLDRQIEIVNDLMTQLSAEDQMVASPPRVLTGIAPGTSPGLQFPPELPPRPEIPLSASDLLFNGAGQPTIGSELRTELQSATSVDLICAFVIWSGVRVLREQLADLIQRGGRVRVVTTTYMSATEPRALEALAEIGAEIRIAYDARTTKLHAKSWLLERPHGLTTTFIGSSNLSYTALHEGLEWNVRLSAADAPYLVERVRATFQTHWENPHFERYDPAVDSDRLQRALDDSSRRRGGDRSVSFAGLEVHPYPHQRRMLEQLEAERTLRDHHRNLVVAATGTGKTVVAALDYRDLCRKHGKRLSLLFVAHRMAILRQSQATFRAVMKDGSFGEIRGDGQLPRDGTHVFAMIQSLGNEAIKSIDPDAFDVVVVDEFHHAAAPTYDALLEHVEPIELLGLTATPERMDEADITAWFGGRIAVEMRLWDAIDQGFLCPFQYFGISDGTDLRSIRWSQGSYATGDLSNLYTGDDLRVAKLLEALQNIVADPGAMQALGFCVSVEHAEFMADRFTRAGLPAASLSGKDSTEVREQTLRELRDGDLCAVFSVDVLGEGVDVPSVDTIMLLRPTQSATVFLQQLGRGLRIAEGKPCLTVLDMIGQQHESYRFDRKLRAVTDRRNGRLDAQTEAGFPFLPSGCEIQLDRVSQEIILDNLRATARLGAWRTLRQDLTELGDVDLLTFLEEADRVPAEFYRPNRSFTKLRIEAGVDSAGEPDKDETALLRALPRLLHVDDRERVALYRDLLTRPDRPSAAGRNEREERLLAMLHFDLWGVTRKFESLQEGLDLLWTYPRVRVELEQILTAVGRRSQSLTRPLGLDPRIPLQSHGVYSRDEVLAGFGVGSPDQPPQVREGVKWVEDAQTDLFFVTLEKADGGYSPTTMYRDYAISPELFHWESQSVLREGAPTAQRYINHVQLGSDVVIFVRSKKRTESGTTAPYTCLGPATYVQHEGEKPLAITWRLRDSMPEELFEVAQAVAAA